MPLIDRCIFLAAAVGTADFVVASAVVGYQTPAAANVVNGQTYHYAAQTVDSTTGVITAWEVGNGTYSTTGPTLARTTVLFNSLGTTAKVAFTSAPQVMISALAEDFVSVLNPNTWEATQTITNLVVDQGSGSNNAYLNLVGRNSGVGSTAIIYADYNGGLNLVPANGDLYLVNVANLSVSKGSGNSNATITLISWNSGSASPSTDIFTDQLGGFNISVGTGGVAINQYLVLGTAAISADTSISRSAAGVIAFGKGGAGDSSATFVAKTTTGVPTTSDVPAGTWALIRDTANSTTKMYYNNAGTLQSVALT